MKNTAEELLRTIENANLQFANITEEEWSFKSAPEKWSKKEILGHLIDSAANNHQRFVRLQFEVLPAIVYDQNKWAEAQNCVNAPTENLIGLFTFYNKHLAYVLSQIPEEHYNKECDVKHEQPVTLRWLAEDYVRHMRHHLNKISGN